VVDNAVVTDSGATLTHSDGRPVEGMGRTSRWIDLDGPVHYVDHGGPAGAEQIVLVHGLGGSHANWTPLAPLLTPTHRVLALDLAGFGLTVGGPRPATVQANQELLHRFLTERADGPVTLVGNSMGGLISALETAAHPDRVSRLVLIDPALPIPVATPDPLVIKTFGELMLPRPVRRRIAAGRGPKSVDDITRDLLRLVTARPISADSMIEHTMVARMRADDRAAGRDFGIAWQSLLPFLGLERRRLNAVLHSISVPVLLLHGDRDRLINIRAARIAARANPDWTFVEARGMGHVPQLEDPRWTAEQILSWLPRAG
jgi:pimeloyl-ACP methyl ester carboxylesterase